MLNWRKALIAAILVLIALFSAAYAADVTDPTQTVNLVDAERISVGVVNGLSYQETSNDGELSITIDSAATDWLNVIYQSTYLDNGYTYLPLSILPPEGAVYEQCAGTSEGNDTFIIQDIFGKASMPDENQIKDAVDRAERGDIRTARQSVELGQYSADTGLFQSRETSNFYVAIRWFDKDGNVLCIEKLKINLSHTNPNTLVEIQLADYPVADIVPAYGLTDEQLGLLTTTNEPGQLTYTLAATDMQFDIITYVLCPEPSATMDSGWKLQCSDPSRGWYDLYLTTINVNGSDCLAAEVSNQNSLNCLKRPDNRSLSLRWISPEGKIEEQGVFVVTAQGSSNTTTEEWVYSVDPYRIMFPEIAGMTRTTNVEPGAATLTIDSEETDWTQVLDALMDSSSGAVSLPISIRHVGDAVLGQVAVASDSEDATIRSAFSGYSTPTANELIAAAELAAQGNVAPITLSREIGQCSADASFVQPTELRDQYLAIRWFNSIGKMIRIEKLKLSILHTNPNASIKIPLPKYPAKDIVACYGLTDAQLSLLTATTEDGQLSYRLQDTDEVFDVRTFVLYPDPAATAESGWTAELSISGGEWNELALSPITVDGTTYLAAEVDSRPASSITTISATQSMELRWRSADGAIAHQGRFTLKAVRTPKPWTGNNVNLVDAERISVGEVEGLVYTATMSKGAVDILIDSDETNWEQVLYSAMAIDFGHVRIPVSIAPMESAVYNQCTGFGGNDDDIIRHYELNARTPSEEEIRDAAERAERGEIWPGSQSKPIGQYSESTNLFQPIETDSGQLIARWFDANGKVIAVEKLQFSIRYTNSDVPIKVPLNKYPTDLLATGYGLTDEQRALVTVTKNEPGQLTYLLEDTDQQFRINTYALCPDPNATTADGWKLEVNFDDGWQEKHLSMITVDGVSRLAAEITSQDSQHILNSPDVWGVSMRWISGNDEIIQQGILVIKAQSATPKIWTEYTDYEAVPASNITISKRNAVEGMNITYENGVCYMTADLDAIPSGARLGDVDYTVTITPPEGAVAYRWNRSGGNQIFGRDDYRAEIQDTYVRNSELYSIEKYGTFTIGIHPVREFTSSTLSQTLYLSSSMANEFGGAVNLVYWYDTDENIIARQWVAERYEPIDRVERTQARESESEIDSPVHLPVIVIDEGGNASDYMLSITTRLHDDDSAECYELELVDAGGNIVTLPGTCKLYLPYPSGHDENSLKNYTIRHYNGDYTVKEVFSADKAVTTPIGICIEVSSLSPFIMTWSDRTLVETRLPAALVSIDAEAFRGSMMESVYICDGCTSIGEYAFADMSKLVQLRIPSSVTAIDATAFSGSASVVLVVKADSYALSFAQEHKIAYRIEN